MPCTRALTYVSLLLRDEFAPVNEMRQFLQI